MLPELAGGRAEGSRGVPRMQQVSAGGSRESHCSLSAAAPLATIPSRNGDVPAGEDPKHAQGSCQPRVGH